MHTPAKKFNDDQSFMLRGGSSTYEGQNIEVVDVMVQDLMAYWRIRALVHATLLEQRKRFSVAFYVDDTVKEKTVALDLFPRTRKVS